jgi:hypothetical protein
MMPGKATRPDDLRCGDLSPIDQRSCSKLRTRGQFLRRALGLLVLIGLVAGSANAQPNAEVLAAFDRFMTQAEAQLNQEVRGRDNFLAVPLGVGSEREARLRQGEVIVEERGTTPTLVPGGMIHRWRGIVFVPKAKVADVLRAVQDYDHGADYYRPEVDWSRTLARNGDDFRVAMRLRKKKVITVVLDTEYDVHYGRLDETHQYSVSKSTKVTEIEHPGEANEKPLAEGSDHGFLILLYSYWRFVDAGDGVFVQCEAISVSRAIRTGLNWLVGPFARDIPRESLQFTLTSTREAVRGHMKTP